MAAGFTILTIVCLAARGPVTAALEPLPISRHGHDYVIVLSVLVIMAVICWVISLGMLLTSPAQQERYAKKNARFDATPNDPRRVRPNPSHPGYHTPIWCYWLGRGRG